MSYNARPEEKLQKDKNADNPTEPTSNSPSMKASSSHLRAKNCGTWDLPDAKALRKYIEKRSPGIQIK